MDIFAQANVEWHVNSEVDIFSVYICLYNWSFFDIVFAISLLGHMNREKRANIIILETGARRAFELTMIDEPCFLFFLAGSEQAHQLLLEQALWR